MGTARTADLVAAIREKGRYTQEALARELGVSFATINAWERGRSIPRQTHVSSLETLASSLGIQTDLTVLAIDDDPAACAIIEGLVAGSGLPARVETTTDPTRGLILAGALDPDLLLLDIMMPDLDGFELARQLGEIPMIRVPVIVFVTAAADERGVREQADGMGHRILAKPLRQETMNELLESVAHPQPVSG